MRRIVAVSVILSILPAVLLAIELTLKEEADLVKDGEALMKIAPTLVDGGWTAEHFDAIGREYPLPLKVHWTPSPKNPKWKDVTAVELAQ